MIAFAFYLFAVIACLAGFMVVMSKNPVHSVLWLLEAGATEKEVAEVIYQMSMLGGLPAMNHALELAQEVFDERKPNDEEGDA